MTEKDYQRKKNKFLPKIHAWYVFFIFLNHFSFMNNLALYLSMTTSVWVWRMSKVGSKYPTYLCARYSTYCFKICV